MAIPDDDQETFKIGAVPLPNEASLPEDPPGRVGGRSYPDNILNLDGVVRPDSDDSEPVPNQQDGAPRPPPERQDRSGSSESRKVSNDSEKSLGTEGNLLPNPNAEPGAAERSEHSSEASRNLEDNQEDPNGIGGEEHAEQSEDESELVGDEEDQENSGFGEALEDREAPRDEEIPRDDELQEDDEDLEDEGFEEISSSSEEASESSSGSEDGSEEEEEVEDAQPAPANSLKRPRGNDDDNEGGAAKRPDIA